MAEKLTPQEQFEKDEEDRQEAERKAAAEEQKEKQRKHEASIKFMQGIYGSNEGFAPRKNGDDLDYALAEGLVYMNAVQSGPGGLDVEERVYLSEKGYNVLHNYHGDKAMSKASEGNKK